MAKRYIGIGTDEFTVGQGPLMFRNRIINGNFDIWQRGTSQTASGFGSDDRWSNQNGGSTKTASRQAFTLGQIDVPGEPAYFSRTAVTSVAGASNFTLKTQAVESVRTFAGQTATLSFWAKADASKNIAIEFMQGFGSGGSPSAAVTGIGVTTCALTTSWKKFTVTVAVPSISGKTIGTDGNDYFGVVFWLEAGSSFNARTNSLGQQSGTFDIAQVQLEAGSSATEFEFRPLGTELALCRRYFERIDGNYLTQHPCILYRDGTYSRIDTTIKLSQTKRGSPVVTHSSPTLVSAYTPGANQVTVYYPGALGLFTVSGTWTFGPNASLDMLHIRVANTTNGIDGTIPVCQMTFGVSTYFDVSAEI